MKDFYKILGVKENASEEEIRERWIELTKCYHPDRVEDMPSDERIKEINEAYQVLKHSSTRAEYDLKRTYAQEEKESKKGSYLKKFGVPASVLILVIIFSVLYFKNFQNKIDSPREMGSLFHRGQTDQINQVDQTNHRNQTNQIAQQTQQRIDVPAQQPKVVAVTPAVPIVLNQRNQKDQRNKIGSSTQRPKDVMSPITPSIAMAATMEKVQLPQPSQNPITPLPNDVVANKPTHPINQTDQINQVDQTNLNIELAQFKPPPLLATEDEVRRFFNHYIEYYTRKDIESFLSLFSSKATQNQKDGLEGIRKIYTDFFDQGQDVRYSLQDMKIEIYQNAVEVKARYEIGQTVIKSGERKVWRGWIRWVLIKEGGALKILSIDYQHEKPALGKREETDATS